MSLYDKSLATYDEGDAFDHASAVGFIEIFGLPLRVEAARHGAVGKHHGAAWTWTDPLLDGPADDRHRPGAGRGLIGPTRRAIEVAPDARSIGPCPSDATPDPERRLRELAFLHEHRPARDPGARLGRADAHDRRGTTVAMGVEVCSFYLADRERRRG